MPSYQSGEHLAVSRMALPDFFWAAMWVAMKDLGDGGLHLVVVVVVRAR